MHTTGNSSIDTSLILDIYCGPEVLFETCVTMKFVDGSMGCCQQVNKSAEVNVPLRQKGRIRNYVGCCHHLTFICIDANLMYFVHCSHHLREWSILLRETKY